MKEMKLFKSAFREQRESRDMAIYKEYNELTSIDGQSKTLVTEHLMQKYGIHSQGTIYAIRQRVEKRLQKEGKL